MTDPKINSIYEKVPAVICTAGSYIAAANKGALKELKRFCEGELLYDSMRPEDILKFEADLLARDDCISPVFRLRDFYGYRQCVAMFRKILGKSFAVVFLFKNLRDDEYEELAEELAGYDIFRDRSFFREFIQLSNHSEMGRLADDEARLINMYDVCRIGIKEMMRRRDIYNFDISFCENDGLKRDTAYFSDVPLRSFLQVLFLAAALAGEITVERQVGIKLCRYGNDVEIRVTTDCGRVNAPVNTLGELSLCIPSAASYAETCEYVSSRLGCTAFVLFSEREDRITLVFSFGKSEFEDVDFKSPLKLERITDDCGFVLGNIFEMKSGNAKEQGEYEDRVCFSAVSASC